MICLLSSKNKITGCLSRQYGFNLIEMAIVLVILAFVLGGVIRPLTSQREVQKLNDAEKQLEEIRNAIIGYVHIHKRLPCPASLISNGVAVMTAGVCVSGNDLVPYADLGIRASISNGVLVDVWDQPLRYRLTDVPSSSWSYATQDITFSPLPNVANFRICSLIPCNAASITATDVVFVLFSTGDPDSPTVNLAVPPPNDFLNTAPRASFDDRMIWVSRSELVYEISKSR